MQRGSSENSSEGIEWTDVRRLRKFLVCASSLANLCQDLTIGRVGRSDDRGVRVREKPSENVDSN